MKKTVTASLFLLLMAHADLLNANPRMDLVANRYLWHLDQHGLVIPVASEGLRKYVQTYKSPWGDVHHSESRIGRVLNSRTAELQFPWVSSVQGQESTVRIHVRGAGGRQRLSLRVNGAAVGARDLSPTWQVLTFKLKPDALHMGENRIRIDVSKPSSQYRYGLFHSIAIGTNATTSEDGFPPLSPVSKTHPTALSGFDKMTLYLEVAANAFMRFSTKTGGTPARFQIKIEPEGRPEKVVFNHVQNTSDWQEHTVQLDAYRDVLVRLTLEISEGDPARSLWGTPEISVPQPPAEERVSLGTLPNAILFVGDALRADRLRLYRPTEVRTPRLTAAAGKYGVVFLNHQAMTPSSPPSHASIQTGMTPRVHGVQGDKSQINSNIPLMSATLRQAGVQTAYYGNNPFGMARLEEAGHWNAFHQLTLEGKGPDCSVLVAEILAFVKQQSLSKKRFFVSALAIEPHVPYRYHPNITEHYFSGPFAPPIAKNATGQLLVNIARGRIPMDTSRWSHLKGLYDGEVEYMDGCFGQLLDGLDGLKQLDRTAIILTGDHGEGFWEHKKIGHAFGNYIELTRVPLVVLLPGVLKAGSTVDTGCGHIDIAPTILDMMGVTPDSHVQGESLLPLIIRRARWLPRVVSSEYGRSYALKAKRYRYVVDYEGNEELFDLEKDPYEQANLVTKRPLVLRYFRDLTGFYLEYRVPWRMRTWGSLDNQGKGLLDYLPKN